MTSITKNRLISAGTVALVAASLTASPALSKSPARDRLDLTELEPDAVPGEVIVGYKRRTEMSSRHAAVAALGGRTTGGVARRTSLVRFPARSASAALEELRDDPNVAYVEPNLRRNLLEVVPNDIEFANQWGLRNTGQEHVISGSGQKVSGGSDADMDVSEAWDITQGSDQTVVAILDSGVDTSHPDLAGNLWANPGEIAGDGIDNDGNGYVDDVNGFDFAEGDNGVFESNQQYFGFDHGTHVAGTVAAVANNSMGVAGVCPNCKIMVLKVFEPVDTDGNGQPDTMAGDVAAEVQALDYAIRMGADVINGSFGAALFWSRSERAAIKRTLTAGISVVFAAGNTNGDNDLISADIDFDGDGVPDILSPAYPASYELPGIISVAASNDFDQNGYQTKCALQSGSPEWPCAFTNFGHDSVDLSGPGVDVISTVPGGYDTFDGTSMASPHVAGVVALLTSQHPEYTPTQVRNALMNSVDKPSSLASLFFFPGQPATGQFTVTGGRSNAFTALSGASTTNSFATSDGTIAGARAMTTAKVSGNVAWPADTNDVYKKKLTKGVRYRVILNGPDNQDFDLAIYKPGVKGVWQLEEGCLGGVGGCKMLHYNPEPDADESASFKATKSKVYRFHVAAYLFSSGNYTLKVRKL